MESERSSPSAANRYSHGPSLGRPGTAIPPAVHAASCGALRRKHRPELHRRRHAGAARAVSQCRQSRRERRDQVGQQGAAPEKIIANRFTGGVVTRSRPLCPFPAQAVLQRERRRQRGGQLQLRAANRVGKQRQRWRHCPDQELAFAAGDLASQSLATRTPFKIETPCRRGAEVGCAASTGVGPMAWCTM